MKTSFLILVHFFLLAGIVSAAGQDFKPKSDLRSAWLVLEEGRFIPFESRQNSSSVIYFRLPAKELQSDFLKIESSSTFNIFINNNLAASGNSFLLNIDSLAKAFSSNNLIVGVYQEGIAKSNLVTELQERKPSTFEDMLVKRNASSFNDFAITGILLLIIFGIVIVRLNPKLASDYFSVARILSTREMDEGQTATRIGSSTNILFYLYSSMLLAYYLIIVFHFVSGSYPVASSFAGGSFIFVFLDWLKLTAVILLLQFLKIILLFGVSYLFGIPEIAGFHFFNWVRLLLIVLGMLVAFVFIYLIWHGQSVEVHSVLLKLLGWVMVVWMILIFLKLSGKVGASMFHLFSYICATELIPFLFIIKVLYN